VVGQQAADLGRGQQLGDGIHLEDGRRAAPA
jgi:hypothetical protein